MAIQLPPALGAPQPAAQSNIQRLMQIMQGAGNMPAPQAQQAQSAPPAPEGDVKAIIAPTMEEFNKDDPNEFPMINMEKKFDDVITKNKLQKGDIIQFNHPAGGVHYYQYLGPNSGGRKDYILVQPPQPGIPTS